MTRVSDHTAHYAAAPLEGGMRVNARLDEATSFELRQLMGATGLSVTDVIREAIHRQYLQESVQHRPPAEVFADLIGAFEGPLELSSNYKNELLASLAHKHE